MFSALRKILPRRREYSSDFTQTDEMLRKAALAYEIGTLTGVKPPSSSSEVVDEKETEEEREHRRIKEAEEEREYRRILERFNSAAILE